MGSIFPSRSRLPDAVTLPPFLLFLAIGASNLWTQENEDLEAQALASETIVPKFVKRFKEFPPSQKAASFTIDLALDKMAAAGSGSPATTKAA